MADLVETFKRKAEDLITSINQKGGIKATLEGLRRQMAEADRRRAITKVKEELRRLDRQINEMITAVGIQAVGLHQAGRLSSPELTPLCQHIVELKTALAQQEAELAKLEAQTAQAAASGPAVPIQRTSRRDAPTSGSTDCATASTQARARAK